MHCKVLVLWLMLFVWLFGTKILKHQTLTFMCNKLYWIKFFIFVIVHPPLVFIGEGVFETFTKFTFLPLVFGLHKITLWILLSVFFSYLSLYIIVGESLVIGHGSVFFFYVETTEDNTIPLPLQHSMCGANPLEKVLWLKGRGWIYSTSSGSTDCWHFLASP
jgi:hypothetical protein